MLLNNFLSMLASAINRYLQFGTESNRLGFAKQFAELEGRVISITLLPFHFTFQMTFSNEKVKLYPHHLLAAETKIIGTPLQLLSAILSKDKHHHFFADDLIIEGNAELGQQVAHLFDVISFDWDEYLSRMVGDTKAHYTSRFVRSINKWIRHVDDSFSQNVNEYIHEEAAWLASRNNLNDFFIDIDTLRMDVDRIESRVKKLNENIMKHEDKQ